MSRFTRFFGGMSENFRAGRFQSALNRLSDGQLADMGLTRAEVPQRARELARL